MPDRLLYAISSAGKMSISSFDAAFNSIFGLMPPYRREEEVSLNSLRRETIRFLDACGFCEFDFDRRYVYACRPAFVGLPGYGLPKALFIGARTPLLLEKLHVFAKKHKDDFALYTLRPRNQALLLPQTVYAETSDPALFRRSADFGGIECRTSGQPAAWLIASFSADLHAVRKGLSFVPQDEPRWPKREFSLATLSFSKYSGEAPGMRLAEYTNPIDQQRMHWIWDNGQAALVDRDWGRFMVLAEARKSVFFYDKQAYRLAVPTTVPLPRLLARAVALCTGIAPVETPLIDEVLKKRIPCHVYSAVIPAIADILSAKLRQKLRHQKIPLPETEYF